MRCVVASAVQRRFCWPAVLLICVWCRSAGAAVEVSADSPPRVLTNLLELQLAEREPSVVHLFQVIAKVMDVDAARGVMLLRDGSGEAFVRVGFTNQDIVPGATVRLEGRGCAVVRDGFGLALIPGLVVDNDGVHPSVVQSGKTFLPAGANAIRLTWFNRYGVLALHVEYEGPGVPRQPIPDSALSHAEVDSAHGRVRFLPGLRYRVFQGDWEFLPDFDQYRPIRTGVVSNFDSGVRVQDETVGIEFSGFIRLPEDGVYTFHVTSDDGSRLFVGAASLDIRVIRRGPAPMAELISPRGFKGDGRSWVTIQGTVDSMGIWSSGGELRLRVGEDDIRVEIFDAGEAAPSISHHDTVLVTGLYEELVSQGGSRVPGRLMALSWRAIRPAEPADSAVGGDELPGFLPDKAVAGTSNYVALTTAAEVKALSPQLAQQGLPVSIRGVVTAFSSKHTGAVIQDATRGVFVDLGQLEGGVSINRGDFCEVEGITGPGWFAPSVIAHRITRLGAGSMPKPVRATWSQLMNGSLDTEYAELDGLVTEVQGRQVVLFTQGGKITVELRDFRPEVVQGYEGALVRIRGCFLPNFDMATRKLETGAMAVSGAAVEVLQSPPSHPFDAPRKSIGELLYYDPEAVPFRRLTVGGQVIFSREGECYLTDGTNSMRVTTSDSECFAVGDVVDAVGFLELGGHTAELKEALLRKTGQAPLPAARKLGPDELLLARHAGTFVQVKAVLINDWREGPERVMELQSGYLAFKARVSDRGMPVSLPARGSLLELTGVYAPQGKVAGDGKVNGFELLLGSAAGIRVLTTPPWWTLKRVLILAGILGALLCGALLWNKELQAKVEERGRLLEAEVRNRQRAELQRAAEAERSRIARDLHDDLGTGLTEVSLLASAGLGRFEDSQKVRDRFHSIAEKARALVSGLDAIIWAIDPKRNSLQAFADYVTSYADELFSNSGIVCRIRVRIECGAVELSESKRHSLFLAVKEALNNVIRHAAATEVELRILQSGDRLEVVIADNGRGFDWKTIRRGNGLANLQERLQAMHGERLVESEPGKGTTVRLVVPIHRASDEVAGPGLEFDT